MSDRISRFNEQNVLPPSAQTVVSGKLLPIRTRRQNNKLEVGFLNHSIVVIASAYRTEDPRFESRQGVRFLEINTF
jgi:hypothetical protein